MHSGRTREAGRSLFAPRQRGGVIGGGGYNFQDAFIVTALPTWLADPSFRSFIKEGFEDVDVSFGDGRRASTWHYQLKDHAVTAAELRAVLAGFGTVAGKTELNATRLILGCAGLAANVASLWRMIKEFRGASKTYAEGVLRGTRKDLEIRIARLKLMKWSDLVIDRLDIDHENPGARDPESMVLMERFRGKFVKLPQYHGEDPELLDRLFARLLLRINKSIRMGIARRDLLSIIEKELAAATKGKATVVYLHGWIRQRYDVAADFEIDWTRHFDHAALRVASPPVWQRKLLPKLHDLRARLDGDGQRRTIWLRTRAPLSAGIAFGHALPDAAGYTITVQQPSPGIGSGLQYLRTGSNAGGLGKLDVREIRVKAPTNEVAVGIGITDDPRPRIEQYARRAGLRVRASLYLYPHGGHSPTSINEKNAGAIAAALKKEMRLFANRHGANLIHLFFFGPLGVAVLLGQKLNGLPDIQCYERNKADGYSPSCRLPC